MIGDGLADFTYKDCQREMDMFNRAFCELMIAGDSNGRPFAYPHMRLPPMHLPRSPTPVSSADGRPLRPFDAGGLVLEG